MTYELGIDAGTTYTAAAIHRDGRVEIVPLGDRAAVVPSVIFLKEDGSVVAGDAANRRALTEPQRVALLFKRRLGDDTPILLGGAPYSAEALLAKLLRWTIDQVTRLQGEPPGAIALTHPANWGPFKKERLQQAIRLADIDDATTLTEPEAAAIFYASNERVEPGSIIAVYDLGGGTFDAAVLRKTETGGWQTLGTPEGIEQLGGIDFDEAVFGHVRRSLPDVFSNVDSSDTATLTAVASIRRDCVDAKEALSSDTDVSIPVLLPGVQAEVRLTRSEFEGMIRPTLQNTVGAMHRALRSAGVVAQDVSAVLLVGGSSRIPLIAELVGAELGRPVAVDAHPKHAIALGAALASGGAQSLPPLEVEVDPGEEQPQTPVVDLAPTEEIEEPVDEPAGSDEKLESAEADVESAEESTSELRDVDADDGNVVRRRRMVAAIGGGVALLVALGLGVNALGGGDGATSTSSSSLATTTSPPDEPELAIGRRIPATHPDGIAKDDEGNLWVAASDAPGVIRIDPSTGARTEIPLPGSRPISVAIADGGVWVTLTSRGEVVRIDPGSLAITKRVPLAKPVSFGQGHGSLWVVGDSEEVVRLEPSTGDVDKRIAVPSRTGGITFTDAAAWVTLPEEDRIVEIDPNTNRLTGRAVDVGDRPNSIGTDSTGALWVTNRDAGTVSRVDPSTQEVETLPVGSEPADIAIDGTRVWVADHSEDKLVLIDAQRVEVVDEIEIGAGPFGIAVLADSVWVSTSDDDVVVEVRVNA